VERDLNNCFKIAPVIRFLLSNDMPIKDTSISYFSQIDQAYTFIGKEPVNEEAAISFSELDMNGRITLRCRQGQNHLQQL
jgi:hypothetical protein